MEWTIGFVDLTQASPGEQVSRELSLIEPQGDQKKNNQYNNANVNRRVVSAKEIQRQAKCGRTYGACKNRYRSIKADHPHPNDWGQKSG